MIAMRRTDDLTIKTLHAAVDFIVKDSGVDVCQYCAFYKADEQNADEHEDCCVWHRKQGDIACRDGVIEKFQMELTGGAQ